MQEKVHTILHIAAICIAVSGVILFGFSVWKTARDASALQAKADKKEAAETPSPTQEEQPTESPEPTDTPDAAESAAVQPTAAVTAAPATPAVTAVPVTTPPVVVQQPSEEDRIWFVNYNNYLKDDGSANLSMITDTDALMHAIYSGNGTTARWDFNPKPTKIGSAGEMIYYYGKDVCLSYYPSDHHITIVSTNENFNGYYRNKFNFDGNWTDSVSQRCSMSIFCQNDAYYEITIHWSAGASDSCDWEFSAEYDNQQGALVYQNGRYTETHYPDGGSPQTVVKYTNGIGRIYPMDGKLYWDDYTEGAGDSCVFVR